MKTLRFLALLADTDINTQRNVRFFKIMSYFLSAMGFAVGLVHTSAHESFNIGFMVFYSDSAIVLASCFCGIVVALGLSYAFSWIIQHCDIFSLACKTPEDMAEVKQDLDLMDKITQCRQEFECAMDDEDTTDSFTRTLTQNYIKEQTHLLSKLSERHFNRVIRNNVMSEIRELEKNINI